MATRIIIKTIKISMHWDIDRNGFYIVCLKVLLIFLLSVSHKFFQIKYFIERRILFCAYMIRDIMKTYIWNETKQSKRKICFENPTVWFAKVWPQCSEFCLRQHTTSYENISICCVFYLLQCYKSIDIEFIFRFNSNFQFLTIVASLSIVEICRNASLNKSSK